MTYFQEAGYNLNLIHIVKRILTEKYKLKPYRDIFNIPLIQIWPYMEVYTVFGIFFHMVSIVLVYFLPVIMSSA